MAAPFFLLCLLSLLSGATPASLRHFRGKKDVHTVTELKLDNYYGRWYEMYSDLIVKSTFERNSYCTTATYGKGDNNTVTVFNSGRLGSPTGSPSEISGYAYVPDPAEPGKLKLKFPNIPLGDYWVVALGPVENDQYQYSVVTEPSMLQLFILARDPADFRQKYQDQVLDLVKDMGFTRFWNKPMITYQGSDCIYPDPPEL
ncbi:uncharacterized protein [Diadema antillarum]|uniref:uncharacterized protein n=1 Tax=Diadema antillarum TaxID=105358 RepID=UPI003A85C76C